MKRLTTDKPVSEMGMVELAHNSCYAKEGEAFYRDFDGEISARDFARKLYKIFSDDKLSDDNDKFDEEIMDELQYDPEIYPEGFIALFYRNIWAMADLRETLKRYEDLGTVEELQQTLEKQIPKKPILKHDVSVMHLNKGDMPHEWKRMESDNWHCPVCDELVGERVYLCHGEKVHDQRKKNYCDKCGQAIDWASNRK